MSALYWQQDTSKKKKIEGTIDFSASDSYARIAAQDTPLSQKETHLVQECERGWIEWQQKKIPWCSFVA